jgi:enamine deaminase RidA (YjgF/YER057c/UK114 family)
VRPDRLGRKPRVALDLLAMAPPADGGTRLQQEYEPKTNVLRSLTWGGIVFMSGVTDMTPLTLAEQVPVIVKRLSDTLAAAGASWDKVVRASFMLHHEEPAEQLHSLFSTAVAAAIPCRDTTFVDTRQGKRVEIELTAKLGQAED